MLPVRSDGKVGFAHKTIPFHVWRLNGELVEIERGAAATVLNAKGVRSQLRRCRVSEIGERAIAFLR